jgi:hypothetical protein
MADPISLAASIAGLLSLGEVVIILLQQYSSSVFEYHDDIAALEQEIKCLVGVLRGLKLLGDQIVTEHKAGTNPHSINNVKVLINSFILITSMSANFSWKSCKRYWVHQAKRVAIHSQMRG